MIRDAVIMSMIEVWANCNCTLCVGLVCLMQCNWPCVVDVMQYRIPISGLCDAMCTRQTNHEHE